MRHLIGSDSNLSSHIGELNRIPHPFADYLQVCTVIAESHIHSIPTRPLPLHATPAMRIRASRPRPLATQIRRRAITRSPHRRAAVETAESSTRGPSRL